MMYFKNILLEILSVAQKAMDNPDRNGILLIVIVFIALMLILYIIIKNKN